MVVSFKYIDTSKPEKGLKIDREKSVIEGVSNRVIDAFTFPEEQDLLTGKELQKLLLLGEMLNSNLQAGVATMSKYQLTTYRSLLHKGDLLNSLEFENYFNPFDHMERLIEEK